MFPPATTNCWSAMLLDARTAGAPPSTAAVPSRGADMRIVPFGKVLASSVQYAVVASIARYPGLRRPVATGTGVPPVTGTFITLRTMPVLVQYRLAPSETIDVGEDWPDARTVGLTAQPASTFPPPPCPPVVPALPPPGA